MKSLKVALVVEAMDTGVARLVSSLATGLAGRGHDVVVFHALRRVDPVALARLRDGHGVTCIGIDMQRSVNLGDLMAGQELRRAFRHDGPFDIIHGHSTKGGALARLAGLGLPGIRLYTPHALFTLSPELRPLPRFASRLAERILARFGAAVVCSSSLERDHALGLGIPSERLTVIPNGIEPPALAPADRSRFGLDDDETCVVGFVGRLEHQKAPDVMLHAMADAVRIQPKLMLVMIGYGSLEAPMKALATELGLDAHIRWLGRQPSTDYLGSFDLLAQPSRYEGFSLMPLEAMHAGLPIVCTPVGGVAETVVDRVTGLVVPVEDRAALAQAILTLAGDPERRRALGAAARDRAKLFPAERMVQLNERLYLDLLEGRLPVESGLAGEARA